MTHELTNLSENLSIRFAKQLLTANKPITAYAVLSKLLLNESIQIPIQVCHYLFLYTAFRLSCPTCSHCWGF